MNLPTNSFSIRYGPALWTITETNRPLIEGLLWEEDVVMLLGSEKAGKSILAMQMAFNLTSGEPFLDKYKVVHPMAILYVQTEGKPAEMVDRMIQMREALQIEEGSFYHLFQRFFPLDRPESVESLHRAIEKLPVPPKVIFIDSLYTSILGDLTNNQHVRALLNQLSSLINRWHCAIVIIHHETKEQKDEHGVLLDRGDKASYGSVFLRSWVGHILYLKKHADKTRTLVCDTQRSGKVLDKETLVLVEPKPLLFQIAEDLAPYMAKVSLLIPSQGITREELISLSGLSEAGVDKAVRQLYKLGRIEKTRTKPVIYKSLNELDG